MDNTSFYHLIIMPGLEFLKTLDPNGTGGKMQTPAAQRMLLSIARQESGPSLDARYQNSPSASPGPARGWWQFEEGGGVKGVLNHSASKSLALAACSGLWVQPQQSAVWRAIEGNDVLATSFARLLLWTDAAPLTIDMGPNAGWDYYVRNWRPGKPHRDTWNDNWVQATDTVMSGGVMA